MKNSFCIIGAGIAGTTLAKQLHGAVLLEKSRGVGGRLAARRLGPYYLNHGPEKFLVGLDNQEITDPHGWIKEESKNLEIYKSWEVSHLEIYDGSVKVFSTSGALIECKKIIITAPAPQAQQILQKSDFEHNFLSRVKYKKIIQLMILSESQILNPEAEKFLIIKRKLPLPNNLFMILFEVKDEFLEVFFSHEKDDLKNILLPTLSAGVLDSHVHKWRYSEVLTPIPSDFQTALKDKNIYLAGDYFGDQGISSSLDSVKRILPFLS